MSARGGSRNDAVCASAMARAVPKTPAPTMTISACRIVSEGELSILIGISAGVNEESWRWGGGVGLVGIEIYKVDIPASRTVCLRQHD